MLKGGPVTVMGPEGGASAELEAAAHLRAALVASLAEALGGFEVLTQQLELSGTAPGSAALEAADLVGHDGAGRLVLVLLYDAETDLEGAAGLLRALDLAAEVAGNQGLLERHWGRNFCLKAPLVVLVGSYFPTRLQRRVAVLGPDRVRLFQVSELRSAEGATTYFTPWAAGVFDGERGQEVVDVAAFLADLEPAAAGIAAVLRERLARLVGDLQLHRTSGGIDWRWRGYGLCSISVRGERIEGRVDAPGGGVSGTIRNLSGGDELEAFLDAALVRFLALEEDQRRAAHPRPGTVRGALDVGCPAPGEPLLSREELDMFLAGS